MRVQSSVQFACAHVRSATTLALQSSPRVLSSIFLPSMILLHAMAGAAPLYGFILAHVIRGHHVYKRAWTPFVGEELPLQREPTNRHDAFAVAIKKGGNVVGRVPRELSCTFWTFIQNGGDISCEVTGQRKKGKGLEVPCLYKFKAEGNTELIDELKVSIKHKLKKQ